MLKGLKRIWEQMKENDRKEREIFKQAGVIRAYDYQMKKEMK